jgi:hypothetical protein
MQAFIAGLQAAPGDTGDSTVFPGDGVTGPALAYQDNGDGTITDLNTGLMWEKKVAGGSSGCPIDSANLHGVDSTCTWAQATGAWIAAINAEGGTGLAGHNDWRVPNVKELQSIVHYGLADPAIDPIFSPTTADNYWSSTTFAFNPSSAWFVIFEGGHVFIFDKNMSLRVRAVRGGP